MSKKLISKNDDFIYQEVIDTPPEEIIEENFYIDENNMKNKDLIRMDMNLIQFPIFSKNSKRKVNQIVKYYFNSNRDIYITVKPSAGDYIPGETEEKIFIALMQIMKEREMPQKFIVTSIELKNKINLKTDSYNKTIKKSLLRLSESNYNFKNTLYSSKMKGIIKEEISTPILMLRIVTLSLKENKKYREQIEDKRIKEVYEITISDHFYNNIIEKGYMVYNGNTLLNIESSTARTIYMLIEKLRFDNLYLKIDTLFLIKRIPLKYSKKTLSLTLKTLKNAFEELKNRNLIKDFSFIKDSTWEKSEVEIYFNEKSNIDKQGRFYEDRNDFRKILTMNGLSDTEHHMIEDIEILESSDKVFITEEIIDEVLNLMPKKAKELKTMPKTIKDAIEKYGLSKVKSVSKYMKKQKVEKVRVYFLKALENDWIEDEEIVVEKPKAVEPQKITPSPIVAAPLQYNHELYEEFLKLPQDIQDGVESYAYSEYIKKCGMKTKIQEIAFRGSRKKHICEFLEKHPEILNEIVKKEEPIEEEYLTDIDTVMKNLKNAVTVTSLIKNYSEEEKGKLLNDMVNEILPLVVKGKLTEKILEELVKKYLGSY